jgi:hypothetical protein
VNTTSLFFSMLGFEIVDDERPGDVFTCIAGAKPYDVER